MTDNYLYRAFWISPVPIGGSEKIQIGSSNLDM